jgi:hypothetical protein
MKATRRTQPYRKSAKGRPGGRSLAAMLNGRTLAGSNPADTQRAMQKRARGMAGKPGPRQFANPTGGTLAPMPGARKGRPVGLAKALAEARLPMVRKPAPKPMRRRKRS